MSPPSDGDGRLLSPQSIVAKVFTGFLLGLGFAIPFFSIEAISSYFMARAFRDTLLHPGGMRSFGPDAGLEIVSHEARESKTGFEFLGTLKNAGNTTWDSIRIEVVFYGAEDQPTGQCLGYYFVPIRAGEERLFQFDCYRAPPYSRYTIEVVDATHSMGDGD